MFRILVSGLVGSCLAYVGFAEDPAMRKFLNRERTATIQGALQSTEGSAAIIRTDKNKLLKVPLSKLSSYDVQWIKAEVLRRKKVEKAKEQAQDLIDKLALGENNLSRIKKLQTYGKVAIAASDRLKVLVIKSPDVKEAYAAMIALMAVCEINDENFRFVIAAINRDSALRQLAAKECAEYLRALSRFDLIGLPYLVEAAYSGSLQFDFAKKERLEKPVDLDTTNGIANRIRAASCLPISLTSHSQRRDFLYALLESAEINVNGKQDTSTIVAVIDALANCGHYNAIIVGILDRYEKVYPRNVAATRKAVTTMNKRVGIEMKEREYQAKLERSRQFKLTSGRTIFVQPIHIKAGNVRLQDFDNQVGVIPLKEFTAADQAWINKNVPIAK